MMHSIPTYPRLSDLRHSLPTAGLMTLLSRWLQRCWKAQCRQAERPGRIVPRY